jgi:integrase
MSLTDTAIRNAKPAEKPIRLFDGGGLYLEISPNGGKWWRLKFRVDGKEKRLSLGVYPDVGLKDARERRDSNRKLLAQGVDLSANRKATEAARADQLGNSFEVIGREWFVKRFSAPNALYRERLLGRLEKDIYPWVGKTPITELKAPLILSMLRRIEDRGAIEMASRALQYCSQIFRYAISTGRAEYNPCGDLRGALQPLKKTHRAALTEPKAVGQLLRAMDSYEGYFVTKCALRLIPLVFVRSGELCHAEWKEIDLDKAEWNIPAEKMKMGEPHLVPLSSQAVDVLRELQALTGNGRYVFPCARSTHRPMSNMAILAALRRMGFTKDEMTVHGFRAMARTMLDEQLKVRPDYIEHQLAHAVRDPNGRAYNRTSHLPERRKMMQLWASYLDDLREGAKVIPFKERVA